eukprot:jgi/Galph1/5204/GphlegSOOS_G3858.1
MSGVIDSFWVHDFRMVQLPLKNTSGMSCEAFRWIYLKKQKAGDTLEDSVEKPFLFVANLPLDCTVEQITEVLEKFGKVERVLFGILPETERYSKHASVFFRELQAIDMILRSPLDVSSWYVSADNVDIVTKKLKEYQKYRSNPRLLAQEVDQFLFSYREKQEREAEELKAKLSEPDEEGFITVGPSKFRRNSRNPHQVVNFKKKPLVKGTEPSVHPVEGFYRINAKKHRTVKNT